MSNAITKTIPQAEGEQAINKLYDGSIKEWEFHMAGKPSKLKVGDFVYTIFKDKLVGRLKITRFNFDNINPKSGKPQTLIYVSCPGQKLKTPIDYKGHRGTRYYKGEELEINKFV